MEEVTSNVTIAVIMDYLACHELEYSGRKVPLSPIVTRTGWIQKVVQLNDKH